MKRSFVSNTEAVNCLNVRQIKQTIVKKFNPVHNADIRNVL